MTIRHDALRGRTARLVLLLVVLALLATACGGGDGGEDAGDEGDDTAQEGSDDEGSDDEGSDDESADDPEPSQDEATEDDDEEPTEEPAATEEPAVTATAEPTQPAAPPAPAQDQTIFSSEVPMTAPGGAPYTEYTTVTDDTGRITVEIPAEWTDVDGAPIDFEDTTISDIRASTDLAAFAAGWDVPGVAVTAGAVDRSVEEVLDGEAGGFTSSCTPLPRQPYADPLYTGSFDTYSNCGGTETAYVIVAARAHDGTGPLIEVQVQLLGERDVEALDRILQSFVAA